MSKNFSTPGALVHIVIYLVVELQLTSPIMGNNDTQLGAKRIEREFAKNNSVPFVRLAAW